MGLERQPHFSQENADEKYSYRYPREDYLKIIAEQPNEEINGLLLQHLKQLLLQLRLQISQ